MRAHMAAILALVWMVWQSANGFCGPRALRSSAVGLRRDHPNLGARSKVVMMPIGVPKVAYRVPGAQSADWIDIYNRLYRERIIFLGSEIDDELANQIIGVMLYLDSESNAKPIYLYINCPGGSVIAGLAIFDTMNHIKSKVVTINVGLSASMASFLLCGGTKGMRLALPHSRVMIHQVSRLCGSEFKLSCAAHGRCPRPSRRY